MGAKCLTQSFCETLMGVDLHNPYLHVFIIVIIYCSAYLYINCYVNRVYSFKARESRIFPLIYT